MSLTHKQRSEISRKAARKAWKTMHSAAYIRAAKKSESAVKKFLASRKAA